MEQHNQPTRFTDEEIAKLPRRWRRKYYSNTGSTPEEFYQAFMGPQQEYANHVLKRVANVKPFIFLPSITQEPK